MKRLMVVRVELEDKTEEYKYCWHSFFFAKIGNYFITHKSKSKKTVKSSFTLCKTIYSLYKAYKVLNDCLTAP